MHTRAATVVELGELSARRVCGGVVSANVSKRVKKKLFHRSKANEPTS